MLQISLKFYGMKGIEMYLSCDPTHTYNINENAVKYKMVEKNL
jgi:hypothetical protein